MFTGRSVFRYRLAIHPIGEASALGIATASAVAILWMICSLVEILMPGMAMNMSGSMLHTDFAGMQWSMNLTGFIIGLVIWSVFSGILAWLTAVIYNRLN